ncbi:hypothetical protein KEJ36_04495 [Candidatus Bathyarchaeota archaeon]|nr:hypothetical protein [Candidatus Bathyarchaeota archaeon]MBS7628051.1 hypothetical protein [Candidatus Bathyarchaeota archaeon]
MRLRVAIDLLPILALFCVSVALLGAIGGFGKAHAAPSWLKPGATMDYLGNSTRYYVQMNQVNYIRKLANVSWTVEKIENGTAFIRQRVSPEDGGGSLENLFKVDAESRLVLDIDDEPPLNETYAYFWIDANLREGDLIKVEDMVFSVEPGEPLNVSGALRETWVLRGDFTGQSVNGTVFRWYDRETGIQLRAELNITMQLYGETTWIIVFVQAKSTNIFGEPSNSFYINLGERERNALGSLFEASILAAMVLIGRRVLMGRGS